MIATLRKMMTMVQKPGRYATGLVLIGLVAASLNILTGLALMFFINAAERMDWQLLYNSLAFMIGALLVLLVLMPLGYWLFDTSVVYTTTNLRHRVFQSALRLSASWLGRHHSGDLTSRATNDVQTAEQAYGKDIVNVVEVLVGGIGSLAAMLIVDWKLALGIVALGALRVAINALIARPLERTSDAVQKSLGTVTEQVSDIANGGHEIRMFNYQSGIRDKFQHQNELTVSRGMERIKYAAIANGFSTFASFFSFFGLAILGIWLVRQGWYDFGTIMLFVQLQNGINALFGALGHFITQLQTSLAGGRRALEIIEQPPEPARIPIPAVSSASNTAVAMEDVSFSYPSEQKPALEGVNILVQPGETVALVGPSGGGKSTLFKLLLGYYPPTQGSISLRGRGLEQYHLNELRQQIAYVPQVCYLFSGSIAENIAMGKPAASQAEIESAAKAAYAHDFIMQQPQGYAAMVGERGSHLSGGQRQRIAIARAILRDAPILLLDEATSALDTESEKQVQLALERLMRDKTTLVIAHRLSTVQHAQRILVVDQGTIAEEGNHETLLQQNGIYWRLHHMQFQQHQAG